LEVPVTADLDTLLIALYVELTDRIIPSLGFTRHGPGKPPEVTDAELVCLAVAQVLLRYDDERHWLRAAAKQVGHWVGDELYVRCTASTEKLSTRHAVAWWRQRWGLNRSGPMPESR
jgi:hypothetical protein